MRLPQVSERIKEAPAQALRGVFAGIGQLLLVTDKLRNKAPAHADVQQTTTKAPPAPAPAAEPEQVVVVEAEAEAPAAEAARHPAAAAPEAQRDFDKTGNVRLLTEEAEPAEAVGGAAPLPNYDALTVASLRARLRNLSIEQVRELAEYERAHAGRPEVITMFERRVAKLEAGA
jgi:hypothetical protein